MTDYGPYEAHPLADAFPLIEGEEFDALVADIRENGLGQPIMLTADGATIVDGRNRYRACVEALRDASFKTLPSSFTEEQIGDYIRSENLYRRHLTAGQKAFVAKAYKDYFYRLASKRKAQAPGQARGVKQQDTSLPTDPSEEKWSRESAHQAAKKVGSSGTSVKQAEVIERDAPDLADQVKRGKLAIDKAYKETKARVAERRKREPEPKEDKKPKREPVVLTLLTHTGKEVPYPQPKGKPKFNDTSGPGISWAGWSWNPVTGCLHGCDYCYAREIATSTRYADSYPVGFTPLYHPERLDAPANTTPGPDAQGRVFVCSMADLYGRWVPDEWIESVHQAERANPQWEYLHLTKFPDRYPGLDLPKTAWIGTSVDEQSRVRIAERAFSNIDDVKVKWLSLEPLREPLEFSDLSMFDWIVIGAQTGTTQPDGYVPGFAPPIEWVSRLIVQAMDCGVRVHTKPNLFDGKPGMTPLDQYPTVMECPF